MEKLLLASFILFVGTMLLRSGVNACRSGELQTFRGIFTKEKDKRAYWFFVSVFLGYGTVSTIFAFWLVYVNYYR